MTDRHILFSGSMIRALLAGTKTQTRRILKPQPTVNSAGLLVWERKSWFVQGTPKDVAIAQRIGVGDRLWVKENHAIVPRTAYRMSEGVEQTLRPDDDHDAAVYAAEWDRSKPGRWRPSIHMPRWASRLTLIVTDVRVARLQAMTFNDLESEGIVPINACMSVDEALAAWQKLWDGINGKPSAIKSDDGKISHYISYPWDGECRVETYRGKPHHVIPNPWVAAYTFTVQRGNIDKIGRAA